MPIEHINEEACIGCGTCVSRCPMDVLRLNTLAAEKAQQSPCSIACPLGVNQREYHNLIELDMLDEAVAMIAQAHPMPAITGRICPHPCETACTRGKVDSPININGLEQYLGDRLLTSSPTFPVTNSESKVAIIGSGPAGLSAAYHLRQKGHRVTVFEKEERAGGLLRTSIPSFRLSEEVIDKQIELYKQLGIEFCCGVTIGQDITLKQMEEQGYNAVIAATGASKPLALSVAGSDAAGITSAIDFLYKVKAGTQQPLTGNVAVIGGGSVALDAARTAIRLGADSVNVICLERVEPGHKDSMLAHAEEINDAIKEGVIIHPSTSVTRFETENSQVASITLVDCLSVRDPDGRFNPVYGENERSEAIKADTVILAIGQTTDINLVPSEFATNERGQILANANTHQVSDHLFAIGDGVTGPTTVVAAAASGKNAAINVDLFLKGEEMATEQLSDHTPFSVDSIANETLAEISKAERIPRQSLPVAECKSSFKETLSSFSWDEAAQEAERCLTCGSQAEIAYKADCQICNICQHYCPTDAITITPEKVFPQVTAWG